MNRIWRIWKTTTFRQSGFFVLLFVLFSVFILGYIAYQTSILIQQQQIGAIDRELGQLNRTYQRSGTPGLIRGVQRMADRPGPGIYYVADPTGQQLAGNVDQIPTFVLQTPGIHSFRYEVEEPWSAEQNDNDDERRERDKREERPDRGLALVKSFQLPSGFYLVVGRDIEERRGFSAIIFEAFGWGVLWIIILSVLLGTLLARNILRRLDMISAASKKIMTGDLAERLPLTKRNDEYDRVSKNLNEMLDRIENLMAGLKEVTDNVAHDLKTPLTRLRNKVERALQHDDDPEQMRKALQATIDESDQLIRTFNALLLIARVEAGAPDGSFEPVAIDQIIEDIVDLYQPVAEDSGIELSTDLATVPHVKAGRELIGQAIVNLVENAIKYAKGAKGTPRIEIGLEQHAEHIRICVSDNGTGIPEKDRQRVLERFVRLEASRSETGSGLGLSLVSAVARLHKGTLEIKDNDPGTKVLITLPKES
ncbi:putative sensor protein PcoS [Maritalea myrionectae]|uniref:histidine kinase n=1 Tax=Maritalea myrionectae TaxID=454601 RepID=A0A2R4MGH9_9HYPH|nr:HAMP domain-containing sensor histidine kinase [Maritalea myrionectae]AVX05110.1 putative sensor protein PcoS [Maritalea myrionectae]